MKQYLTEFDERPTVESGKRNSIATKEHKFFRKDYLGLQGCKRPVCTQKIIRHRRKKLKKTQISGSIYSVHG